MATHRISILGPGTVPEGTGNVFFQPFSALATTVESDPIVAVFVDPSSRIGLRGSFEVPKNYVDTPKFVVTWAGSPTSGAVEWDADYHTMTAGETFKPTSGIYTVNQDGGPANAWNKLETSLTLTSTQFAVDDTVLFELFRDGTDAGDTMAASAVVFSVQFEYNDA
jgi:hypothetical protein